MSYFYAACFFYKDRLSKQIKSPMQLYVKVDKNWRNDSKQFKSLGIIEINQLS